MSIFLLHSFPSTQDIYIYIEAQTMIIYILWDKFNLCALNNSRY